MKSYYVDQNMNTNKLQISSDFLSLETDWINFKEVNCLLMGVRYDHVAIVI